MSLSLHTTRVAAGYSHRWIARRPTRDESARFSNAPTKQKQPSRSIVDFIETSSLTSDVAARVLA